MEALPFFLVLLILEEAEVVGVNAFLEVIQVEHP
jgi:hypothetical protein